MRFRTLDASWQKTLAFAAVHLVVAVGVGYLVTGSFVLAGLFALIEPALNTLAYHRLDTLWPKLAPHWRARPWAKTAVFTANHLLIALTLGWLLSGSLVLASLLAFVEPLCNGLAYHLFERAWRRHVALPASGAAPHPALA